MKCRLNSSMLQPRTMAIGTKWLRLAISRQSWRGRKSGRLLWGRSHPLFHFHQTRLNTHHPPQPCTSALPIHPETFPFLDEVPPRSQCGEILSLILCMHGFPITYHNEMGQTGLWAIRVCMSDCHCVTVTVWATGWCAGVATLSTLLLEALGAYVLHCYLPPSDVFVVWCRLLTGAGLEVPAPPGNVFVIPPADRICIDLT